jgi:cell division protein FtsB
MIEVLKQSAEDVSKAYDILAFGHTERALEILAKTRTSLRQAIAKLESQNHIKQHLEMINQLSAAQRNELSQIEDGTWEADRNG